MNARLAGLLMLMMLGLPAAAQAQPADGRGAPARDVGRVIDDTAITTKIKSEFVRDNEVNALDVSVTTRNGEVKLGGRARSERVADKAVQIARSVPGVVSVSSAIEIRPY